jgi:uncharacterized surface protein with fasciclin (FAS1) repeats
MWSTIAALAASAAMGACAMNGGMEGGMDGGMNTGGMAMGAEAGGTVMVGGAAMYPNRNIVQNAMNSRDHTTLVAAVKQAGLVETLSGPGPFTVFAPTNQAFSMLPQAAVASLMQDQNRAQLTKVLTYHVVPGRLSAQDLMNRVRQGGGRATLTTVQGDRLTVMQHGSEVHVTDTKGNMARVTIANVFQSNGVIHVVDKVLMPS